MIETPLRVLLATRLSRKRPGQTGIETQDVDARTWSKDQGFRVVHETQDRASGDKPPWERKELGPWMTDQILMAQYDAIVAATQSRLSRGKWADEVEIRQWADKHGKEIFIVDTGLHWPPRDIGEQIRWELDASRARAQWEDTSKLYRRNQAHLRENNYLVGVAPYGYRIVLVAGTEHKTLEPDLVTAEVVRKAVDHYLNDNWSLAGICTEFDREGIPAPRIDRWEPQTLAQIFRNPVIAGRRKTGSGRIKSGKTVLRVPPIIDMTTWKQLQAKMDERANRRGVAPKQTALLTSILVCGLCDGKMYRIKTNGGVFYRCHGTARDPSTCRHMRPLKETDQEVRAKIDKHGGLPHTTARPIQASTYADQIEHVEQDIRELDLDDPQFLTKQASLMERRKELRDRVKEESGVTTIYAQSGLSIAQHFAKLDTAGQRAELLSHGAKVTATPGQDLDIDLGTLVWPIDQLPIYRQSDSPASQAE